MLMPNVKPGEAFALSRSRSHRVVIRLWAPRLMLPISIDPVFTQLWENITSPRVISFAPYSLGRQIKVAKTSSRFDSQVLLYPSTSCCHAFPPYFVHSYSVLLAYIVICQHRPDQPHQSAYSHFGITTLTTSQFQLILNRL